MNAARGGLALPLTRLWLASSKRWRPPTLSVSPWTATRFRRMIPSVRLSTKAGVPKSTPSVAASGTSRAATATEATESAAAGAGAEARPKESHMERFKSMWRSYGYLFVGTYFGLYFGTLGSSFGLVHSGIIKGPDVNTWLNKSSVKNWFTEDEVHLSPLVTEVLTAWLITKTTEPLRFGATMLAVPLIVRYLPLTWLRLLRVNIPKSRLRREAAKVAK